MAAAAAARGVLPVLLAAPQTRTFDLRSPESRSAEGQSRERD